MAGGMRAGEMKATDGAALHPLTSTRTPHAMVIVVEEGTIESRILHLLMEMYPATVRDVERELKVRPDRLDRALKGLALRGIVELDPLPGAPARGRPRAGASF